MGNCLDFCGNQSLNIENENFHRETSFSAKNKDKNLRISLKDFKKLRLLGQGALGTVFFVEMKKTSLIIIII